MLKTKTVLAGGSGVGLGGLFFKHENDMTRVVAKIILAAVGIKVNYH